MSARGLAVVWGLGRFGGGLGAARELARRGFALRIVDRASREELAPSLGRLERDTGRVPLVREDDEALDGADLLCVNPGVRPDHALLATARRREIPITQELDLFVDAYPGAILAVTGTNGKSSTSAMLARSIEGATGKTALLGGNLGGSLFEARSRWHKQQFCVLEISSFQASRLDLSKRPFAGLLITNLTTDHLDWHGGIDAYHAAKLRLLDGLQDGAPAFLGRSAELAKDRSDRLRLVAPDSLPSVRPDGLWIEDRLVLARSWLRTSGEFQFDNARLALALVHALGLDAASGGSGLRGFRGLPHRLARVGTNRGITFFDNAVSTGVDSTRSALESLCRESAAVRWIAGGRNKGVALEDYVPLAASARSVHLFGEVAAPLARLLRAQGADVSVHERVRSALEAAHTACEPGDALLFSPGFSSFDQYPNFEARARDALAWWHSRGFAAQRATSS